MPENRLTDTERFDWFFGSTVKTSFINVYLDGIANRWTPDKWRAAIDREIAKERDDVTAG